MLQSIREKAQGWIAKVILILITVAFSLWGIQSYVHRGLSMKPMAEVDGHTIYESQWHTAYERAHRQMLVALKKPSISDMQEQALKESVLKQMMNEYVMTKAASKMGFMVNDEQVVRMQMAIPTFQENGQFSARLFHRVLNQLLMTESEFYADLRHDLISNQVEQMFSSTAFALSNEVDTAVQLIQQKRDVAYLIFPVEKFKAKIKLNDAALQKFYEENKERFKVPESVKLQYITLSSDDFLKTHKATEQQIKDYYENNKDRFRLPGQWQVAHILIKVPEHADKAFENKAKTRADEVFAKLEQGANFADLAKVYSDDIISKNQGGDLGWVSRGMLDSILQNTVTKLRPGQFSKPVRSKYGYGIVKLTAVKPGKVKPIASVRATVAHAVVAQQMDQWFAEKAEELSDLVYANPDTLKVASEQLGLPIQETPFITHTSGKDKITQNPDVIKAAFSPEVIHEGYNSNPIELGPQSMLVIRKKAYEPMRIAKYQEARPKLKNLYLKETATAEAMREAKVRMEQLNQGKSMVNVSKKLNIQLTKKPDIARFQQNDIDEVIRDAAFKLPRNKAKQQLATAVALDNGDVAIVTVTSIKSGVLDKKSKNTEQKVFMEELAARLGDTDYDFFVQSLLAKSKTKMLISPQDVDVRLH